MSDANDFLDRVNRSGQNHAGVERMGRKKLKLTSIFMAPNARRSDGPIGRRDPIDHGGGPRRG